METVAKIRRMHYKERLSQRAITEKLQLNRRTVNKYHTALEPPNYTARPPRYPKLGAFIPAQEQRLNAYGSLTAIQRFEWLKPVAVNTAAGANQNNCARRAQIKRGPEVDQAAVQRDCALVKVVIFSICILLNPFFDNSSMM